MAPLALKVDCVDNRIIKGPQARPRSVQGPKAGDKIRTFGGHKHVIRGATEYRIHVAHCGLRKSRFRLVT
ncbi:uncharacterized protein G2W53_038371 [Senna tora]|uniref:Uncharacterized protein n=1 Tax=Senna tora TaxID=362788 RepID=A0A834W201_9FABA|nr:uncharacterized protein G2W53_038371 [Senna tora]